MRHYFKDFLASQWRTIFLHSGGLWFVGVLASAFAALGRIRNLQIGGHTVIGMGPLQYIDVYKDASSAGYTLTFHFKSGLLLLALCCLALEFVAFWIARRVHQKPAA
jgi:hypothetical protein